MTGKPGDRRKRPFRVPEDWSDWAPTEAEMKARLRKSSPMLFWQGWSDDRIDSIEELRKGLGFRCARSLVTAFDPARVPHSASATMSRNEQGIYRRLVAWATEMHDAKLRHFIPTVAGIILREDTCLDQNRFARAIDLHVRICDKEIRRGWLRRPDRDKPMV
ncbi:MAG: hypothetical protein E6Q98_15945 [Rhodospirillaceae bacterium]|nr:MAG: hypothetical protein E6Q98_15945 [Rhodospirillaceae bacterium]